MITYFDDFLDQSTFTELNERMLKRFSKNLRQDVGSFNTDNSAVRVRSTSTNNNFIQSAGLLGSKVVIPILEQIKTFLPTKIGGINPQAYSVWFQYMNKYQGVNKHFDGTVNNRPKKQSYSAFLYAHSEWEDDWGGELCVNSAEVLPKPNRLIVYSRDEEHWVNEVVHSNDEYQRMFFGSSWSLDSPNF